MKLKLAECVATNQVAVVQYNASKVKVTSTKTTNSLVSELLASKKRPLPED